MDIFNNTNRVFWIVVSGEELAARHRMHAKKEDAITAAEEASRLFGGRYYIFEAVGVSTKVDVSTTPFYNTPF